MIRMGSNFPSEEGRAGGGVAEKAEAQARQTIDRLLTATGHCVRAHHVVILDSAHRGSHEIAFSLPRHISSTASLHPLRWYAEAEARTPLAR